MHFLEKQNTLPAQAADPKLPSSSENVIYNHIYFFFNSTELKATVSSQLPLQQLVQILHSKTLFPQL